MTSKNMTASECALRDHLIGSVRKVFAVLCALVICVFVARAQQNTADIVGTVMDTSGAVVPAANVTLTNTGTNITRTTQSSAAGDYTFTLVDVGSYTIKVQANGFKT